MLSGRGPSGFITNCPQNLGMRGLSKIGLFCAGLGIAVVGGVFIHYNGLNDASTAVTSMLASMLWGGLAWFGLFVILMAVLFLNT